MKVKSCIKRHQLTAYFALTLGWSWLFSVSAATSGLSTESLLITVLLAFAGIGPAVAGISLTYLTKDREGRRNYWRRVLDFKRIGKRWYTVIFLIAPVLIGLSALLDILLGGEGIRLEAAADFLDQPLAIFPYIIFILFFGPVPEELGWRGYALDRLQAKWSALTSSLVLGVTWALWHLPLFFVEGTYQYNLDFGTLLSWIYMMSIVLQAIMITWIYNNTLRSTLSAILFHFMINFVGELFELTKSAEIYQFVLWIVLAILVTVRWGPKTLTRGQKV